MTAPLIPQEIYLLERYSSLEYFGHMRDHFAAMVKAAQDALDEFMKCVPPDYRNWHASQQPDQAWGERVIPNMQWALDGLNKGYIRISHDDLDALGLAGNIQTTFNAINRDYPYDWMPQPHQDAFDSGWSGCGQPKSNINITALGQWRPGHLSNAYEEKDFGPLDAPPNWPQYNVNPQVRVKTGDEVPCSGIFLPDVGNSCAQLLIKGHKAWGATVMRHPEDSQSQAFDRVATIWTLVERVAGSGGGQGAASCADAPKTRLRCEVGRPCPADGEWFTPSVQGSRHFKQGEIMPDMKADYGQTIWYCEQPEA
jgi:hypothetical protein